MPYTVYVGACRADGGITKYELGEDGVLRENKSVTLGYVMYMKPESDRLYFVLKHGNGVSGAGSCSSCTTELDGVTENIPTNGDVPCQLTRFMGNTYAVNYLSGSVCKAGCKTVSHKPDKEMKPGRQDAPHTHCVIPAPDGNALMVTDLGMDTVTVCDENLETISVCRMPEGHEVRHLICGGNNLVYSANELAATSSVLEYNPSDKSLSVLGTYPCFESGNPEGNTAAAIRLSKDRKYLYVSNRGSDVISTFALENEGKVLKHLENTAAGGLIPWDFDLTPDNRFLVCACKGSGLINVFEMKDGRIGRLVSKTRMKDAICVLCDNTKG